MLAVFFLKNFPPNLAHAKFFILLLEKFRFYFRCKERHWRALKRKNDTLEVSNSTQVPREYYCEARVVARRAIDRRKQGQRTRVLWSRPAHWTWCTEVRCQRYLGGRADQDGWVWAVKEGTTVI